MSNTFSSIQSVSTTSPFGVPYAPQYFLGNVCLDKAGVQNDPVDFNPKTAFPARYREHSVSLGNLVRGWAHRLRLSLPAASSFTLDPKNVSKRLESNISPAGAQFGVVVASPSKKDPDYFYHWVRDAALVMDVIFQKYQKAATLEKKDHYLQMLVDYVQFSRKNQVTPTLSGLGEPKYYVDGRGYDGPWGRPQNDGPALRAMVLIKFANHLLDAGEEEFVRQYLYDDQLPAQTVIKSDLEYTSHYWRKTCFDLWEEVKGHHFYTRLSQRRALVEGAKLAERLGDARAADWYQRQARLLEEKIENHWDKDRQILQATLNRDGGLDDKESGIDVAVVLGAMHMAGNDGYFAVTDKRLLSSAAILVDSFQELYPVNSRDLPGVAIGRYPEDQYYGGNPWVLATAALAEFHYRVLNSFSETGVIQITDVNQKYFEQILKMADLNLYFKPGDRFVRGERQYMVLLKATRQVADAFMKRVNYHADRSGSLAEQINKHNGYMMAAPDLTWSYAAYLTALWAKEKTV